MRIKNRFSADELNDWDLFVLRHQKLGNIFIHFISFLMFWLSPVLSWTFKNPYFLFGFFTSGLVGGFGHWAYNDGTIDKKEATSSVNVVMFSSLMAFKFVFGFYFKDIQRANQKLSLYKKGQIKTHVHPDLFLKLSPKVRKGCI